jgi:hypothetical protein
MCVPLWWCWLLWRHRKTGERKGRTPVWPKPRFVKMKKSHNLLNLFVSETIKTEVKANSQS